MFSRFFIERPVLSNVLAMVFVLIGLVSLLRLPVSQYPNVVPPTVSVTTKYPGASPKTVMDTVAHPLKALKVSLSGAKTTGAFVKDIPLDKQRPAEYVFSRHVEIKLEDIKRAGTGNKVQKSAAALSS